MYILFFISILKQTLTFPCRFLPLGIRLRACITHIITWLTSSPHLANRNSVNSLLLFDLKPSSVFTSFQITNVVPFNRMALFFSSLRGLPRFGGKPKEDDAIFDISKNGRQPGARPQSTLVERDPFKLFTCSFFSHWKQLDENIKILLHSFTPSVYSVQPVGEEICFFDQWFS